MDRRDREFLDKQMRGLTPPRNDGVIVGMLVAMFLVGVVLGNVLSAHQSEPYREAYGKNTPIVTPMKNIATINSVMLPAP